MSRQAHKSYEWFALVTPPQRELAAARVLGKAGFATFVPCRSEWRFANRIARAKRKKSLRTYPLCPRYVFLGMSAATPGWHGVFAFGRLVQGVIGADKPRAIPHDPLWRLMREHNAGRFNAPSREQYMQTYREFKEGDQVATDDGLWVGKVISIDGAAARIFVELFGAGREVEVETLRLVAAE